MLHFHGRVSDFEPPTKSIADMQPKRHPAKAVTRLALLFSATPSVLAAVAALSTAKSLQRHSRPFLPYLDRFRVTWAMFSKKFLFSLFLRLRRF